jgi:hypothetical protein
MLEVSGGHMNNTQPVSETMPVNQQPTMDHEFRLSERNLYYAVGVVLLLFGTPITGHHQASIVGLALIVLCNLL